MNKVTAMIIAVVVIGLVVAAIVMGSNDSGSTQTTSPTSQPAQGNTASQTPAPQHNAGGAGGY